MATLRNRKRRRTEVLERPEYGWIWKPLLVLLVLYLVICIGLGIWWSQRPGGFSVEQAVTKQRGQSASVPSARGSVVVASLMNEIETLLDKPGGYLHNDVAPPGVWLDNVPSWELGVLSQARLMARALPGLSEEDSGALEEAGESLATDSQDWLYPAAEKRYGAAINGLGDYLAGLSAQGASGFSPDGHGLAAWLGAVSERFDALTRRLSASVDDPEALRELGVDEAELPDATPWFRIDNTFFEARGDAWALTHLLKAVARDYADVLKQANASSDVERMIAELELAQRRVWSPVILNGSGFGIFANHSLVLANHAMEVRDMARTLADRVANVVVEPTATEPAAADMSGAQDSESAAGKAPSDEGATASEDSDPAASGEGQSAPDQQERNQEPPGATDDDSPNEPSASPSDDRAPGSESGGESSPAPTSAPENAPAS